LSGKFSIQDVHLLLAHYGRYKRCVLRYSVEGMQTETQTPHSVTVYGKVDADGLGGLTVKIISALKETLKEPNLLYRFRIPDSLGYFGLTTASDGSPSRKPFSRIVENMDRNSPGAEMMCLEQAVRTCAYRNHSP
jgi:hypothetical protein